MGKMSAAERKKRDMHAKVLEAQLTQHMEKVAVDAYKAGQNDATIDATNIFLWAPKESEGFGTQRLKRVYEKAVLISECINEDKTGLTVEDIKQALLDENGIVVVM